MDLAHQKFNQFQRQSHSQRDLVKVQDLKQEIYRLEQFKSANFHNLSPQLKKDIDHYIRIYRLAIKQIERMKLQFTKPSLVKQRLTQIFDNQMQEIKIDAIVEKTSEIRSSQISLATFKKATGRQNVIDEERNDLASPALRKFFEKKEAEIHNKSKSNFKSVLQNQQNKSFSRSISRDQPSRSSRSNASSFMKRATQQSQLKKVLEENRKIKEEYDKRIKRELQLSQFQKNLLREEKNRYMLKIEELQTELQNLYRANYKLKEQVSVKQKTLKEMSQFDNSASFRNVDEGIQAPVIQGKDYYQPYVMRTKHNDLKRLNMKCHSEYEGQSQNNHKNNFSGHDFFNTYNQNAPISNIPSIKQNGNKNQEPVIDILGSQLQRELQMIEKQKSRTNQSQRSSKKWSKQYNSAKHLQKNQQNVQDLERILRQDDEEDEFIKNELQDNHNPPKSRFGPHDENNVGKYQIATKNPFQKKPQHSFESSFQKTNSIQNQNILPPTLNVIPPVFASTISLEQRASQQNLYRPAPNYSFTNASNKDYSMRSNPNNYDTFEMTKTYLNLEQNQESETNKYIDSRTSTRNKVAFFKDSLILIKNDTFQLAFKKSSLVSTKDRVRVIFFVRNKTNQAITVNLRYEYDASYFKLKVNEKIQTIPPHGQSRQDLEIYAYSSIDLNQVIDVMVQVDFDRYGLWMPVMWIDFTQSDHFKLPDNSEQIAVIPDRQFRSFETAKGIIPLMFGGQNSYSQWAYLYGVSKFGPCYVKLVWEGPELKIQTDPKWIDLLAFVMHHVK